VLTRLATGPSSPRIGSKRPQSGSEVAFVGEFVLSPVLTLVVSLESFLRRPFLPFVLIPFTEDLTVTAARRAASMSLAYCS
jgi:hypothetical protein